MNYFNTPTSFGFTSQSSYSPGIQPNRHPRRQQQYQAQYDYEQQKQHTEQQLVQQSYVQAQLQEQYQNQEQNSQQLSYRREDIYKGLTNIQIGKTLQSLSYIIQSKKYFIYLNTFYHIKNYRSQQNTLILNNNRINQIKQILLCAFNTVKKYVNYQVFQKIKQKMKDQRVKQLKLMYILGRRVKDINCRQYQIFKGFFYVWRGRLGEFFNFVGQEDGKIKRERRRQSQGKIINNKHLHETGVFKNSTLFYNHKMKVGSKLLSVFIAKKFLSKPFHLMISLFKLQKNYSFISCIQTTKKNSLNSQKIKKNNSNSYLANMNNKKMAKQPQKVMQYKIQQKNNPKLGWQLQNTFKILINKKYRIGFIKILGFAKNKTKDIFYDEHQNQSINTCQQNEDDPQIITSMLKHVCWLAERTASKTDSKSLKSNEQALNKFKKLFFLSLKRKQKQNIAQFFHKWQQNTLQYRKQIMIRVKQLEQLKEHYIQSFK